MKKNSSRYPPSPSSSSTTASQKDQFTPAPRPEIPIKSPPPSAAATRIQSAYRGHLIRTLYKTISAVNSQADALQRQIQRQETVDAIRTHEKDQIKMNEALMSILLKLDSVRGIDPTVREARRKVSRRIVGLQEILDGIAGANVVNCEDEWGYFWAERIEEEVCRERGGEEMDCFCDQYLGFRCLQRFLRQP